MTIFARAAIVAALSLGVAGVVSSVPGQAQDREGQALVAPVSLPQYFNLPAPAAQPSPVATALPTLVPAIVVEQRPVDTDAPALRFQSLAAAVAGQAHPADPGAELRCLAGAIFYESKGEPLAGQLAVAEVIINRSQSGRYPRSLCGVITQKSQFSFVRGGAIPAINPSLQAYKTAMAVAQVALNDHWSSPASNALFFHARYVSPNWKKARVASIGNHIFYR